MRRVKLLAAAVLLALAVVLAVQNTEVVTLRFLVWETAMSQIVLLPLAVLLGFALGFLIAKLGSRRKAAGG